MGDPGNERGAGRTSTMEDKQLTGPEDDQVVKFSEILDQFKDTEFLWVYEHYIPELVNIVQDNTDLVIQQLQQREVFTAQEAEELHEIRKTGEKECVEKSVQSVQEKGRQGMKTLWLILYDLPSSKEKHSTARGVLRELQNQGGSILREIYIHRNGYVLRNLKGTNFTNWAWTEGFDYQRVPWRKKARRSVKLQDRYTELIVVPGHRLSGELHNEMMGTADTHQTLESRAAEGHGIARPMRVGHLFRKAYNSTGAAPPVVVVCGVPGIGKTTMVQKLLHDWAAGSIYRQFTFVLHFQFRELNLLEESSSLVNIIVRRHPFLGPYIHQILQQPEQILFVFDGLDESKEKLNFDQPCTDPKEFHPVSIIVASLVIQNLLKGCSVLVTTRPIALETLEPGKVQRYTEILGFFQEQRRLYFEKFYGHQVEGQRVYKHVRGHGILYTLCFNPSYCWILCSALEGYFGRRKGGSEARTPPKTITQLFAIFVANLLTNHARYASHKTKTMLRISKMAFTGVRVRRLVFYRKDLKENQLESSQFLSGFLMEFLEQDLGSEKLAFSFLHLTIQEFLAALHFVLSCNLEALRNVLEEVSRCEDGRYEIFSRFLSGLSKPGNSHTLDKALCVLPKKPCSVIVDWLLRRTQEAMKNGHKRNLLQALHCLFEAQQARLVQRTLGANATIDLSSHRLNPVDCSAVAYTLQSLDTVERFDVSSSITQLEGLDHLIPHLNKCREIRLNNNNLQDEGVQKLCVALRQPGGRFTTL
ncbi:NACHT, LRR and PYD domains-containing protein 3-like, partial [Mustelus asterias]